MRSRFLRKRKRRKRIENKNKKNGGSCHFYRFDCITFRLAVAAERHSNGKRGDNTII